MKKFLFAIMMLITTSAVHADVLDDAKTLSDQLASYKSEYANLLADRATLAKRNDDLTWTHDQVAKQINVYKADRANLSNRMDAQANVIANHNSRCSGTFDDAGYVNACNSEAASIDATSNSLNQENASMNRILDLINEAVRTQTEQTEKVFAQDKADVARMNELSDLERDVIDKLNAINGQVKSCQAAIANVDANPNSDSAKENMHAVCGTMFDGNK